MLKEFLDKVGHDKAILLMHTEVHDENGPDLEEIVRNGILSLENELQKIAQERLEKAN